MDIKFLKSLGFHALLGLFAYTFRASGDLILLGIIFYFFRLSLLTKSNKKHLVFLYGCAYITSIEVLLRMSGGSTFYEASKYLVIVFAFCGIMHKGLNSKSLVYLFYLILLIPGVYLSLYEADYGLNIRKAIAFNLSGPYCLGISALFVYGIKITKKEFLKLLNYFLFPLFSIVVYLFVFNPDVSKVISGTGSNFASSGGFGPNQVATVLGIGMFVLTVRFFYYSKTKFSKSLDLVLLVLFSFRAIVTFSRGGVFTAIIMILVFFFFLFLNSNKKKRRSIFVSVVVFLLIGGLTWGISALQTNGFINKRYANRNAAGIKKKDITTGRTDIFFHEVEKFSDNPFFGVGVGRLKQLRFEQTGLHIASHNEMSRIIAEHGIFGVFAFSILLIVPLFVYIGNRRFIFFFAFYLFWFLTINHSSMRIAAPAFIYALTLLKIVDEKPIIHRKQVIEKE